MYFKNFFDFDKQNTMQVRDKFVSKINFKSSRFEFHVKSGEVFFSGLAIKNYKRSSKKFSLSRISMIFKDKNVKLAVPAYFFGLVEQFFKVKSSLYSFEFGFKEKHKYLSVIGYDRSINNYINSFLFALDEYRLSKIVCLGFFGTKYKFIKFFFNDVYNFFGPIYFNNFYRDYFEFNNSFIFDIHISFFNVYFIKMLCQYFKLLLLEMVRFKLFKDFKNRYKVYSVESIITANKFITTSYRSDPYFRIKAKSFLFDRFNKKRASSSFVNNRCVLTGRSKILDYKFRVSRTEFRRLAKLGYIKGYKRASW
jgi:ribosomal protein S14